MSQNVEQKISPELAMKVTWFGYGVLTVLIAAAAIFGAVLMAKGYAPI